MALVEVDAFRTLLHVRAPLGRSAQEAVGLPPSCFVGACSTGCADGTVVLVPPSNVGALVSTTGHTVRLPSPMFAHPRRPRTAFHTTPLRSPPSISRLSMRTPQMLVTLWTVTRMLPVSARLWRHIRPNQTNWLSLLVASSLLTRLSRPNYPTFWLFPQTSYRPQATTHGCTDLLCRSWYLLLCSTCFPPLSANTSFLSTSTSTTDPKKKASRVCFKLTIASPDFPHHQ